MERILLIGGRGISEVFVRLLKKNGITNIGLISATPQTTEVNAKKLTDKYSVAVYPIANPNTATKKFSPDGVIIASPNYSHGDYLNYFINSATPILCEKPLFWKKDLSTESIEEYFRFLKEHKTSKIFLNTTSRYLARAVKNQISKYSGSSSFEFIFNTHGREKYENIGIDLLPHAFSILHELFGYKRITQIHSDFSSFKFNTTFKYGKLNVGFYLSENVKLDKYFAFSIDDNRFERVQSGKGDTYSLYIVNSANKTSTSIEDPFDTSVQRLLNCNKKSASDVDDFLLARQNMLDTFQIYSTSKS